MNRARPFDPIQLVIENAWDAGHTPRVLVKGDAPGLVFPSDVLARFNGAPIPLDLDPSYPLNPVFEPTGMQLDLAFSGTQFRVTLPWPAVFAVTDLTTGNGFVRVVPAVRKAESFGELYGKGPRDLRAKVESPENAGKHEARALSKRLSFTGLRSIKGGKDKS